MANFILLTTLCAGLFATEVEGYRVTVPLDGDPFSARLIRMDNAGNIELEANDGKRSYAQREIVSWGGRREIEKGPVVLLVDGSLLTVFPEIELTVDTLQIESHVYGATGIPRSAVRGIVFRVPAGRSRSDAVLDRIAASEAEGDQIFLESGDIVDGKILTISDQTIGLMADTNAVDVDRQLVNAVILDTAGGQTPNQLRNQLLIGFRDGSLAVARQLKFDRVGGALELVSGTVLTPDDGVNLSDEICLLRPFNDGIQYLSDMDPLGYKHIPMLHLAWPYRKDRNVLGRHLRCGGQVFTKGLGIHSTSRLSYRLERRFQRFESEIGIDDCTSGRGSVIFRVYTDEGTGAWKRIYESPILRGDDATVRISLDVARANRLSLIVDRADQGDEWDHVNCLNARLTKNMIDDTNTDK